jgi:hypothetical protein
MFQSFRLAHKAQGAQCAVDTQQHLSIKSARRLRGASLCLPGRKLKPLESRASLRIFPVLRVDQLEFQGDLGILHLE